MSKGLIKELSKYDYQLPKRLVALKPASPRDAARILIFDRLTKKTRFDVFKNLAGYLPKGAVLVFNQTKVLPARMIGRKETGGKVKLLFLNRKGSVCQFLCEKSLAPNSKIFISQKKFFTVLGKRGSVYFLKPSFPGGDLKKILLAHGQTPIPPYLRHTPLSESRLRQAYQTIFARDEGSAAAPTASLHFTKGLLKKLRASGADLEFVTLHVGLGTFAPLDSNALKTNRLHRERFRISPSAAKFLNRAKKSGRKIIAVGTTTARTLESAAAGNRLKRLEGETSLFIKPGYRFRFTDGLITNFHVPRSSLLMLVAAMIGRKTLFRLYDQAKSRRFRFFSFGDGMLII